jgi:hypothetical protein
MFGIERRREAKAERAAAIENNRRIDAIGRYNQFLRPDGRLSVRGQGWADDDWIAFVNENGGPVHPITGLPT